MAAEPFTIAIPEEALEDLRTRLRQTRWATDFGNDDWRYGANEEYLHEFVDYWLNNYDWREQEKKMNSFANFRTEIDGVPIHFIHEKGKGPNPTPLILTHGWPWTFWDLNEVIRPLTDPASFGGDPEDAFDVIVPSLPGFGFSTPLRKTGVQPVQTADLWLKLMRDVLEYDQFGAQGGDWGAFVTAQLGHKYPEHLMGIHMTLPWLLGEGGFMPASADDYGPGEEDWFEQMNTRMQSAASHVAVHSNDPQTLAYAMNDSPVGLAAWLIERRRNWSDCDGDIEKSFTKEHLINTVMIYWLTESFSTTVRYYWENARAPWTASHDRKPTIETPTAIAVFPRELILVPRKLAEERTNLQRWTLMPSGGHFAPAEEPELVVEDLRAFFRTIKSAD